MTFTLADVEWGDVLRSKQGVVVAEATLGGREVIVKRFEREGDRREIANYALLGRLGVPTLAVIGAGEDWIAVERLDDSDFREATAADLERPEVLRALARWYATLHDRSAGSPELAGLYCEHELVTPEALGAILVRWPEHAPAIAWCRRRLPRWQATLAALEPVLTYNDFAADNAAVSLLGDDALMFDYNLLGRGYRYADVRNVSSALSPAAAAEFRAAYERLAGPIDPREADVDEPVGHLVALLSASVLERQPRWVEPSLAWLAARDGAATRSPDD